MAAINAGTRRQRGLFGLLCGTISIKKSVLCIGDNSVPENEPTDRVSPSSSWNQQPEIEIQPSLPVGPAAIPSPVLVSKKLAEEAVAKRRNVRFRHHATVIEEEEEVTDFENSATVEADEKLLHDSSLASTPESKTINRRSRQKRMAPAPPLPSIAATAS